MSFPLFEARAWPTDPTMPSAPPDGYVAPASPPNSGKSEPPLSPAEVEARRGQLYELIGQWIMEALTGFFNPNDGGAFDQLTGWANDIPGLGDILDFFGGATNSTEGDNFFTNLLSLLGSPTLTGSPSSFNPAAIIPNTNVAGVDSGGDIGGTVRDAWDRLWSGFALQSGSGKSISEVANAASVTSSDVQSAITISELSAAILAVRNNKPIFLGVDETTESTFPMTSLVGSTPPNYGVTQSTATMGFIRITESATKGFVSWYGQGFASITSMHINIYKMNTSTGDLTLLHASDDRSGDIEASWAYYTYFIPEASRISVMPGDVLGIELRVIGAGTHTIAGLQVPLPDNSDLRPKRSAAVRNAGTGAAPASIVDASVTYSNNVPWFGFGIVSGDIPPSIRAPRTETFSTAGPYTYFIPGWANVVDVIAVGGGGGGQSGATILNGDGGSPGQWASTTLERGVHFDVDATTFTGVVGAGGADGFVAGSAGSASTCVKSGSVTLLSAAGGAGGSDYDDPDGLGPGDTTYNSVTYRGGALRNGPTSSGERGNAPGGGGPGGLAVIVPFPGGDGASGTVWYVARQTPGPPTPGGGFPYTFPFTFVQQGFGTRTDSVGIVDTATFIIT